MFWADKIAKEIIESGKYKPYWVDDMKTPSGRVHVGALMGVVVHDLVQRALLDAGVEANYTYVIENHDPMDDIPTYLPRAEFEKYLGMPLFKIPSPKPGFKDYADYFAQEFITTFNALGAHPKILWTKDLYTSGKMNHGIKLVLDNAQEVRDIYEEMYKKDIAKDWYPFQVYCESCNKVSTTRVYAWDGEQVSYRCLKDATTWTEGCGYTGKTSPFSDENGMKGKMPWKVEWPAKWQAIGVTVEGAGKDHMSRGGSHDLASQVAERVLHYPVPYPVGYEFMLIGGKKMSSSKGRGFAASDILTLLPPDLARFLIVRMDIKKQTNFDPSESDTVPKLYDEYQKAADAYFSAKGGSSSERSESDEDLARTFALSQIGKVKKPPTVRFSLLAQWVQMPNMQKHIEKEGLTEWAAYAKTWVEQYAPESEKFLVQKTLPDTVFLLSDKQKVYLQAIVAIVEKEKNPEELQVQLYECAKSMQLSPKEAFGAIYQSLIGKDHGPKAAWLLLSLDSEFVAQRFSEINTRGEGKKTALFTKNQGEEIRVFQHPDIFSIDKMLAEQFPTISCGIAIIKGVTIAQENEMLEKEKKMLLTSFEDLSTEKINTFSEVQNYRKSYKEMGIDYHSRRPSPEALLRRIAQKKEFPTVNTCVDAYNLVVIQEKISIGAFDLEKVSFPTMLRFAKNGEKIHLLGDQNATEYTEREIAYFDTLGGYNIDFNYRDAKRTAVTTETKNLYINVDGIYTISPEQVARTLRKACDMIIKYCGGTVESVGIVTAK